MKQSLIGLLPWSNGFGATECQITPNTTSITYSSVEFDKMKDKSCVSVTNSSDVNQHPQKWQWKMPPLLRLDSEGEISTDNHFCNRSVNSQRHKNLQLSSSFDLPQELPNASKSFLGRNSEICDRGENNIPCHLSFNQSLPISANISKMPAHLSFLPPSSSLSLSAMRASGFSCPAAQKCSPYSSSPRLLGSADVLGIGGEAIRNSSPMQCICAMSTSPYVSGNMNKNSVNSPSMDIKKIQSDDFNFSKQTLQKSKLSMCNNVDNTATVNLDNVDVDSDCSTSRNLSCVVGSVDDSSQSSFNFSEAKDPSDIVLMRKTKKRRPSRNKRRRRKKQNNTSFTPSCSSPVTDDSITSKSVHSDSSSKACKMLNNVSPIINQGMKESQHATGKSVSPSKPRSVGSKFLCLANSDSDYSLDEHCLSDDDSVFESSIVFCDDKKSASSSNSKKSAKKRRKCKETCGLKAQSCSNPKLDNPGQETLNTESDCEQNSSRSGLHLTFVSLTISEDEENDSSVEWDCSASPSTSDHLIFEFDFNTGLSIESIIGRSSSSSSDCGTSKELRDLNAKWYKCYASDSFDDCMFPGDSKVHFASDEDLVTVHVVGDEDRGGDWHVFAIDRLRFQKRIEETEEVLAPILSESHRAKVVCECDDKL